MYTYLHSAYDCASKLEKNSEKERIKGKNLTPLLAMFVNVSICACIYYYFIRVQYSIFVYPFEFCLYLWYKN